MDGSHLHNLVIDNEMNQQSRLFPSTPQKLIVVVAATPTAEAASIHTGIAQYRVTRILTGMFTHAFVGSMIFW